MFDKRVDYRIGNLDDNSIFRGVKICLGKYNDSVLEREGVAVSSGEFAEGDIFVVRNYHAGNLEVSASISRRKNPANNLLLVFVATTSFREGKTFLDDLDASFRDSVFQERVNRSLQDNCCN